MIIDVMVVKVAGNGYRATTYSPLPATAEGPTSEEALANLREVVRNKAAEGATFVKLDVQLGEHPLKKFAGIFKDDAYFEDYLKGVEEYRRQRASECGELAPEGDAG
jgi:hypothetical protein